MTDVNTLQRISVPSTEIDGVSVTDQEGALVLRFELPPDSPAAEEGFRFPWVRAYRHRAELYCTEEHLEAYDTLVEIRNSPWVAELKACAAPEWRDRFAMNHYMIYLDSAGCYEVVAESWAILGRAR